jgi:DNA-binding HxlR family transcriptional regulator
LIHLRVVKKISEEWFLFKIKAIRGKWKLYIIYAVFKKRTRFNKIKRALGPITSRVLSKSLSDLINVGILRKEKDEYLLTSAGYKIAIHIDQIFTLVDQLD